MIDRDQPRTESNVGEIYLDNNATTRPLPEVVEVVAKTMTDASGNPSSVHSTGERARRVIRDARQEVAEAVGTKADDVVFTSGATEANNLVLQSLVVPNGPIRRLVTTAVEHSSVLATAEQLRIRGAEVIVLPVNRDGLVDPEGVRRSIVRGATLVSVQWANNETGVIQDIPRLAHLASEAGAVFHTDAVQAAGKIEIDLGVTPVDYLSMSGHKLHGPVGVGAIAGPGVEGLRPIIHGGTQESGVRPGTENVPAIAGLAEALKRRRERFDHVAERTRSLRDRLEKSLIEAGLVSAVNGGGAERLPNTSNLQFDGIDGEALTIRLDQLGVRCSQSSACTNQKPEPSYVLRAIGLSEDEAYASVRFGVSELTTQQEIELAVERIKEVHSSLRRFAVA